MTGPHLTPERDPDRMTAQITHIDSRDGAETIRVNGHEIQFGYGSGGDGFCYAHQSFSCVDRLTDDEQLAIDNAEYEIGETL